MSYDAKILCDSIANGVRLTTIQVTFPRIVLAEKNTHRVLSRNSASSRAIPVAKQIARVVDDPFVPAAFAANKKGMQGGDELSAEDQQFARDEWLDARDYMVRKARRLASREVHKQWANRLLEPFAWHTAIVTATDWANFFALRCSPMAQPEIRTAAEMMREAMNGSTPVERAPHEWHLPLVDGYDGVELVSAYGFVHAAKISTARCARVSYLTHEGTRDVEADLALYERLTSSGHWSPLEHAARPAETEDAFVQLEKMGVTVGDRTYAFINLSKMPFGNLRGWMSLRKMMPGEDVFVPPEEPSL